MVHELTSLGLGLGPGPDEEEGGEGSLCHRRASWVWPSRGASAGEVHRLQPSFFSTPFPLADALL